MPGFRGFSQPIPNRVWHQSTLPAGKISNCEGLCTRQAFFCRCVPDQATEFVALAERLREEGLKHGGIGKIGRAVPREFFEVGRQGSGRNRITGRRGSKCLQGRLGCSCQGLIGSISWTGRDTMAVLVQCPYVTGIDVVEGRKLAELIERFIECCDIVLEGLLRLRGGLTAFGKRASNPILGAFRKGWIVDGGQEFWAHRRFWGPMDQLDQTVADFIVRRGHRGVPSGRGVWAQKRESFDHRRVWIQAVGPHDRIE